MVVSAYYTLSVIKLIQFNPLLSYRTVQHIFDKKEKNLIKNRPTYFRQFKKKNIFRKTKHISTLHGSHVTAKSPRRVTSRTNEETFFTHTPFSRILSNIYIVSYYFLILLPASSITITDMANDVSKDTSPKSGKNNSLRNIMLKTRKPTLI
ncbi:hypothetical protein YC2023_111514 [Brassica napus]